MTAKEYLSQAFYLDTQITEKLHQLDQLRSMSSNITAKVSDMPRSSSPNPHSMEDTILKIVDMSRALDSEIDALVDLKKEIKGVIDAVQNDEYRTLLTMRYLSFRPWKYISETMHYDDKYVFEVHGKALLAVKLPRHVKNLTKTG